jgi:hypothetical protein
MATEPDWSCMLSQFLARDPTPMERDLIRRGLTIVSERQPVSHLLPIDEAEEKMQYLEQLEKYWKARFPALSGEPKRLYKPLQPLIVATIMMMDLTKLREIFGLTGEPREASLEKLLLSLYVMPCFIKTGKPLPGMSLKHN